LLKLEDHILQLGNFSFLFL
jgi:hypothetical protein